ncbi:hypothetical protein FGO68_gene9809 [Halteria grandinella]|uniref:Uncharacterized protein n=1 Tax=Halteria grandinella TaxID=5974 RepID=A0A8J8SZS4_HALGN|nr:hypothetical protein FGO68_gene9809 [Halteria grandinella]
MRKKTFLNAKKSLQAGKATGAINRCLAHVEVDADLGESTMKQIHALVDAVNGQLLKYAQQLFLLLHQLHRQLHHQHHPLLRAYSHQITTARHLHTMISIQRSANTVRSTTVHSAQGQQTANHAKRHSFQARSKSTT